MPLSRRAQRIVIGLFLETAISFRDAKNFVSLVLLVSKRFIWNMIYLFERQAKFHSK